MAVACFAHAAAHAQEPKKLMQETRQFRVSVDGKERGKCTIDVDSYDDGTDHMHIDASMKFDYVVYVYRYRSTGNESWKDGKLLALDNVADHNGKKYRLQGKMGGKDFQLAVDGVNTDLPGAVWPTSYWHIPDRLASSLKENQPKIQQAAGTQSKAKAASKPKLVTLVDSDKGTKLNGEMQFIGNETLTIAGKRQACDHYSIRGEAHVDLWYDSSNRLVRQQGVDSGHKTLLVLAQFSTKKANN
jgi:hypothetical protein